MSPLQPQWSCLPKIGEGGAVMNGGQVNCCSSPRTAHELITVTSQLGPGRRKHGAAPLSQARPAETGLVQNIVSLILISKLPCPFTDNLDNPGAIIPPQHSC